MPDPKFNLNDYELEFADTDDKQTKGLAGRDSLAGVAMLFPAKAGYAYWMQDCLAPIDIVAINAYGDCLDFATLQPPAEGSEPERYVCPEDTVLVLELAGGEAAKQGLSKGCSVIPELSNGVPFEERSQQ